ncbi:hypothetical protein Tco_0421899 [Tanacetum coccineum]
MPVDDLLQLVSIRLTDKVDSLEKDLKQTKLTMGSAIVKLVKKVKKLEGILKRRNVVFSDSEEEEPEDQGRKREEQVEDISPNTLEAAKTLSRVASQKPKSIDKGRRYKRRKETKGKKVVTSLDFQEGVNTAEGVNTGSIKVSTISGKVSTISEQLSYVKLCKIKKLSRRKPDEELLQNFEMDEKQLALGSKGMDMRRTTLVEFTFSSAKRMTSPEQTTTEANTTRFPYDKAYNDMQQKIKRLQAHLGDLKGKSSDTQCASNTLDPVSQKLEDENGSLEFQDPRFSSPQREKIMLCPNQNNISKTSKVDNVVPSNPVKTSVRIKPITVSQPNVIHKQQANSDSNGFSSTRVNNTTKTRRPHPRSNSNTDRVPSKSKSSCLLNNVEKIIENHKNSQIPKNQKHMSSISNNITLAIRNSKSEIVCVMCKQCLVTSNHDVRMLNYVNDMNSRADNQSANVSINENQKKHKSNAKKSKELGSKGIPLFCFI